MARQLIAGASQLPSEAGTSSTQQGLGPGSARGSGALPQSIVDWFRESDSSYMI